MILRLIVSFVVSLIAAEILLHVACGIVFLVKLIPPHRGTLAVLLTRPYVWNIFNTGFYGWPCGFPKGIRAVLNAYFRVSINIQGACDWSVFYYRFTVIIYWLLVILTIAGTIIGVIV